MDDGSTDKTAEIAREKGCRTISFPRNFGKASAFYAGIKEALKLNPKAVLTIDADMLEIPRKNLADLIIKAKKATRESRIAMFVGTQRQGTIQEKIIEDKVFSGIRAFSLPGLHYLRSHKFKSIPKRYGLEAYLNSAFMFHRNRIPDMAEERAVLKFRSRGIGGHGSPEHSFEEIHKRVVATHRQLRKRKVETYVGNRFSKARFARKIR